MKKNNVPIAFSSTALHSSGLALLAAGCAGSLIQRSVLGIGQVSNSQLLQVLQDNPHGMTFATAALICQVMEICAVPIFAFLLAEGASRTASYRNYFFRVIGLAAVCEIPYNLLTRGTALSPGNLNPAFGAVLCMVMLYFFRTYSGKTAAHMAIKALAAVGAFLWCSFLGVAFGGCCVIITAVLWSMRKRQNLQLLCGCFAAVACSVFSPLYIFSPAAFLVIYFYDGRRGNENKRIRYLGYPVILIVGLLLNSPAL